MIVGLVVFNVVHPGMVLIGEGSEFPKKEKKNKKEKKGKNKDKKGKKSRSHYRRVKGGGERDLESGSGSDPGEEFEVLRLNDSLQVNNGGRI